MDFSVDAGQPLPASVTAAIRYKNLIGQRFLALGQGAGADRHHAAAGRRPSRWSAPRPPLNLTTLFNGFQPLFAALDPEQVNQLSMEIVQVLQGEGGTVRVAAGQHGVADQHDRRPRPGDRPGDRQPQRGARTRSTPATTSCSDLIGSLQALVSGLAADREPIGHAIVVDRRPDRRSPPGSLDDARPA